MARIRSWLLAFSSVIGATVGGLALFTGATARKAERAVPPQGKFIEAGSARFHYLDQGSGPPIVMIHGLGGQMGNFLYGAVEPLLDAFRVIVIDRPGSGYSVRAPGVPANLFAQAEALAALIAALGLERPLLVGHSLGGAIALATALNHPESVGGLALVAPLTNPQDDPPEALRGLAIRSPLRRWLTAWTLATPGAIRNRDALMAMLFGPDPAPADFATRGGGLLSLRPSNFYAASTDLVASIDDLPAMVARYPSLQVPVGILYGTGDRILDHVANGRAQVGKIPDLDLELIENGGHMIPVTAPERTTAFIRRIAARIVPQGEQ